MYNITYKNKEEDYRVFEEYIHKDSVCEYVHTHTRVSNM